MENLDTSTSVCAVYNIKIGYDTQFFREYGKKGGDWEKKLYSLEGRVEQITHPWQCAIDSTPAVVCYAAYFFMIPVFIALLHDALFAPSDQETLENCNGNVIMSPLWLC